MCPASFELFAPATVEGHTHTPASPPPAEAVDPVCGMAVSLAGAGALVHEGTTFAFCSAGCRARFEADPTRFVPAGAP